jgi:membrane associated rhomboid family serine protease
MRDYARFEYRPSWRDQGWNTMVTRIIAVNVVVHVVKHFALSPMAVYQIFGLTPRLVFTKFYFWQPLTYMFVHADFMHIFFNMLMLWFFGNAMEAYWGSRKFLKYYIACGLGGAVFSAIFTFNGPPVIGASGAIFGLYLAYAMVFPDSYVFVSFLLPVKAKYFVTFLAALHLLLGIFGSGGVAYFAHLGGIAAGLIFFRKEIRASRFWNRLKRSYGDRRVVRMEEWREQERAKIDAILEKIQSKGFENLSPTEKRILENYSRRHKEDSE